MTALEQARSISHILLNNKKEVTSEDILSAISKAKAMNISDEYSFDEKDLFDLLIADFSVGKGEISSLSDNVEPWLDNERANINWELWGRYRQHMQKTNPAFPISQLDDFTNKILDKCVNPKQEGAWDRRGMVVGHVQSGKTSNYVGLINKATDAGYKLIIVIAGTISSLRRQTQERIDSGFIGRSSSAFINKRESRLIGVGHYKVSTDIYPLTSSYYNRGDEGDFNQKIANGLPIPIGNNPVVLVIKKNKSILENLIDWLSKDPNIKNLNGQLKLENVPTLIIDDEADAASVNTSKSIEEAKTINRLIRTLLNLINQKTFIGYTATPYANLFISQDFDESLLASVKGKKYLVGPDLFPKDFIVNIKASSNYIGASKVFGYEDPIDEREYEPLDIFRAIEPTEYNPPFFEKINKNNKDDIPEYLPNSLKTAIKSFFLTCAIRRLRGQENKHNSMLVHVALYVKWIDRVALLVSSLVKEYQNNIRAEDESFMNDLKELFEEDFLPTTRHTLNNLDYIDSRIEIHNWEAVKNELREAILKIKVRAVHGTRSTSHLEYHDIEEIDYNRHDSNGLSVIAVGGSRLARGITLEGLSTSYYLRTTKMYDSLMQMGRWFGYRPGYVDLCRLFTNETIFSWFNHITMATEEMRNDFDDLTRTHQKPSDFRLKVRNHHGLLTISSVAKLYHAEEIKVSFSNQNPQTYQLNKDKETINNNYEAFKNLFSSLGKPNTKDIIMNKTEDNIPRYLLYRNCNKELIADFLDTYKTETPSIKRANLSEYIKNQTEIKEWNVALVSNTEEKVYIMKEGDDSRKKNSDTRTHTLEWDDFILEFGCSVRNQRLNRQGEYYLISKNQIDDTKDRQIDLSIKGYNSNKDIKNRRSVEKKGLILFYALDERGTSNTEFGIPIIGYSIHFPKIDNEVKTTYTATPIKDFVEEVMEDDDNSDIFS